GQLGMTLDSALGLLALLHVNAQRLVGEDVLASVQRRLDLPAVLGRGGNDGDRVDVSLGQHLTEIGVDIGHAQVLLGVLQLCRNDRASCGQLCVRNLICDVLCMDLAQASEACDTNLDLLHTCDTSSFLSGWILYISFLKVSKFLCCVYF